MTQDRSDPIVSTRLILLALCAIAFSAASACSNPGEQARLAVVEYLKNQSVQDVKLDLFHTNPDLRDKAYVSVTVTHNFADAEGKPQLEHLGYVLRRDGQAWTVEHSTGYTKEEQKARIFLAGGK